MREQKCCLRGDDLFCSLRRGGVDDNGGVKPATTCHLDLGNGGADKPPTPPRGRDTTKRAASGGASY